MQSKELQFLKSPITKQQAIEIAIKFGGLGSSLKQQAFWDASTNTPTLTNGTGTIGYYHVVSVGGTVNFGAGNITFTAGDWVYYNIANQWVKFETGVDYVPVNKAGDTMTGNLIVNAKETVGSTANLVDFPNAQFVASQANSGDTHTYNMGVVGEAVASNSDTNIWGVGVYGKGSTNSATRSAGVLGDGGVSASGDTGSAIGVRGYATETHAGGANIALYGDAASGEKNYALYMNRGDIFANAAQIWNLLDNNAASLSFDSTGKIGLLKFITTDGAEAISMSGNLVMSGAAITEAPFVTLASDASGTTDIGAVASNNIFLTGSNTITSFGTAPAGTIRTIRVGGSGGSLITYNQVSLITTNAKNITTAGNDCFTMFSLGSGNWLMLNYKTGNGRVLASAITNLTDASTVAVDFGLADTFRLVTTSAVGATRQLGVPTNVVEGQKGGFIIKQDSSGSKAMTFGWCYDFPQGLIPLLTTSRRAIDFFKFEVIKYVAPATATVTIANPAVVTQTAHGHSDGDIIAFTSTTGALPTGLALNTKYWVGRIDANSYNLFATQLAAQADTPKIETTGSQSGVHTITGMQILMGMNTNIG